MIREMVGLGFKRVELSHGIRLTLVPGILQAVDEGIVEISSVHNFCPLPSGCLHAAPNIFKPSTANRRERALWERHTQQTLDFAVKVAASYVVMHSGSVEFLFRSPNKKLERWIQGSGLRAVELLQDSRFVCKRDRVMKHIKKASKAMRRRVRGAYIQAITWAEERNLKLCIENRESLEELPLDSDLANFVSELDAPQQIGYWHDTGHAQIKQQLGLLDQQTHLRTLQTHLAGFHLHDVTEEGVDHQRIGSGIVDFQMIAGFVRPEHALVLELSPRLSPEDVVHSRDYICALLEAAKA